MSESIFLFEKEHQAAAEDCSVVEISAGMIKG